MPPRSFEDVLHSRNPAEVRFAVDYLQNLAGDPRDIMKKSTRVRAANGWRITCWVFRSWRRADPEQDAMDWLTITKGKPLSFSAIRKYRPEA